MTRRQAKREAMRELIAMRRFWRRMPHPERVRRVFRAQALQTLRQIARENRWGEAGADDFVRDMMHLMRLLFPDGLPGVVLAAGPIMAPLSATYRDVEGGHATA